MASALKAGVVDRVVWVIAPKLLGGRQAPGSVGGSGFPLKRAVSLKDLQVRRLGKDLLVTAEVNRG